MTLACCVPTASGPGSEYTFPTPFPTPSLTGYIEFLIINNICTKPTPYPGVVDASGACPSGSFPGQINRTIGIIGLRNQVQLYGYTPDTILRITCRMNLAPTNYTPYIELNEFREDYCGRPIRVKPLLIDYCDIAIKNTTYILINNNLSCVDLSTIYEYCRRTIIDPLPSRGKWLR